MVDAYAKAYPDKKPVEIWSLVSSNRQSVVDAGRRQGEAAGAGVRQLVRVAAAALRRPHRRLPLRGHLLLVPQHRPDVHATPAAAGGRAGWPRRCRRRSVQFMKTGDPNGAGLTPWPKYTSAKGETLVLDDESRGEERSGPRAAEGAADNVVGRSACRRTGFRRWRPFPTPESAPTCVRSPRRSSGRWPVRPTASAGSTSLVPHTSPPFVRPPGCCSG